MGGNTSILAPRLLSNAISLSSYVDILDQVNFGKTIQDNRFLKSIQCSDSKNNGELLLIKLFIKPDTINNTNADEAGVLDLQYWIKILDKQRSILSKISGVVPFSKIIETSRAAYLIRQYLNNNLYDRLNTRPFLENIEKLWITYQLLNILTECHENGVYHGDIKTENILVTSWNSVFLTDFACYKPVYLPEDNPGEFVFYFDTSQRRNCYLSPERFLSKDQVPTKIDFGNLSESDRFVLEKMDIFSLGCVIAELYLEGGSIFTLSQLFKYRNGAYYPNLDNINNENLKKMVQSMISLDPSNRKSAAEYLQEFKEILFPSSFYSFLGDYIKDLIYINNIEGTYKESSGRKVGVRIGDDYYDDKLKECDHRIIKMYSEFDKICHALKLQYKYYDETYSAKFHGNKRKLNEVPLFPLSFNLKGIPKGYIMKSSRYVAAQNSSVDSNNSVALILLNIVVSSLRNTHVASSRIKGVELLVALSEKIRDEEKLDRVIPFLMSLLSDDSIEVRMISLKALAQIFSMVDVITPINALIFPDYIFPKLKSYLTRDYCSSYEKMFFAVILPNIALNAVRFYDMGQVLKSTTDFLNLNESMVDTLDLESINPEDESPGDSPAVSRTSLMEWIELFTLVVLTGDENTKISFLSDIHVLCSVISKEKTNDIVLSHLITYLNDKSSYLRLAFVESIIGISVSVGMVSLEQYILPLLIQSLSDSEEFIIIQVLNNLTQLVNLDLISKKIIWDLTKIISKLILHPNEWIRQSSLIFIISVTEKLSLADVFCTLYPIIRPYFEYDVTEFNWDTLYPCTKKPISRPIYNLAFSWYLRATNTAFWGGKDTAKTKKLSAESNNNDLSITRSITGIISKVAIRDRQKSLNNGSASDSGRISTSVNGTSIQLTNEDKLWVKRLKASGLQENDLWKIYALRDHISKSARSQNIKTKPANVITNIQQLKVFPRSVFLDIVFKSPEDSHFRPLPGFDIHHQNAIEVVATSKRKDNIIHLSPQINDRPFDSESIFSGVSQATSAWNTNLVPPVSEGTGALLVAMRKATPSLLTNQENIYGELDSIHQNLSASSLDVGSITKSSKLNTAIVPSMTHTYTGNNENILRFLEHYDFSITLDHYYEFGPSINLPVGENSHNIDINNSQSWPPKGILVAHLLEHKGAINCLSASPDFSYFLSGSEDGYLKIWDSMRLERNVTSQSLLSINLKSPVKNICFIENRDCFAVSTKSSIRIFRVSFSLGSRSNRNSSREHYKIKNLVQIRSYSFFKQGEFATSMGFANVDNVPLLIVITSLSEIIGIDIRTMNIEFTLKNPLRYGSATTFCINKLSTWILVGTNKGYLTLWDLRFKLKLKSWRFNGGKSIKKLSSAFNTSKHSFFTLLSDNNGLSIYDMSKGNIQEIYNAASGNRHNESSKKTASTLVECPEDQDQDYGEVYAGANDDDTQSDNDMFSSRAGDFSFDEIDQVIGPEKLDDIMGRDNDKKQIENHMSAFTELKIPTSSHKKQLYLFSSNTYKHNIMFWDIFHSNNSKVVNGPKNSQDSRKKKVRPTLISSAQKESIRNHHAVVTDMTLLHKPFFMVVSGDRNGVINVYK
ncbi:ubiquitin-binding serine/threonine protein kinase [Saccharomycopsis crataegensis]|uniref:non-specific serine/threonine protein kinase n=1 Tax=Saccharomycopsis crataegensis TaxID=43959 RepID=A0AAV5QTQ1_9ASCO|nr:ubiquitin-binding serine/threonine protein kinase [Saccharomycopsis crataegensis]